MGSVASSEAGAASAATVVVERVASALKIKLTVGEDLVHNAYNV